MKKFKLALAGIAILLLAIWLPVKKITDTATPASRNCVVVQEDRNCGTKLHDCSAKLCTPMSLSY